MVLGMVLGIFQIMGTGLTNFLCLGPTHFQQGCVVDPDPKFFFYGSGSYPGFVNLYEPVKRVKKILLLQIFRKIFLNFFQVKKSA